MNRPSRCVALLAVPPLALALSACEKPPTGSGAPTGSSCGAAGTYEGLKQAVFESAERGSSNGAAIRQLAGGSAATVEIPVVTAVQSDIGRVECKGWLRIDAQSEDARRMLGDKPLTAEVSYAIQPSADGKGMVYTVNGADRIVAGLLAAAGRGSLPLWSPPTPAATPQREYSDDEESMRVGGYGTPVPAPRPLAAGSPRAAIQNFYRALHDGDGAAASQLMVPEKRSSANFTPEAMSRFYGGLTEPVTLTSLTREADGRFLASYRYRAGQRVCDGRARITTSLRDGYDLIEKIVALDGC